MLSRLTLIISGASLLGCSSPHPTHNSPPEPPPIKNRAVGEWKNLYKRDPKLLGYRVQQFPDSHYLAPDYEGRHPAMVIYVFKDLRVRQMGFEPDGTVREDFWWKESAQDSVLLNSLEKP